MHKNATKCNKTLSKWCKNKHGASKIIDTFETYQLAANKASEAQEGERKLDKEPQRRKVRQIKDTGWQKAYHEMPSPLSKT
jgi:hypothetical protein